MVDFIKLLVKFIKMFIFLDNASGGAVSEFIKDLEDKYGITEE